jgi:hypothetical protein
MIATLNGARPEGLAHHKVWVWGMARIPALKRIQPVAPKLDGGGTEAR